MPLSDSPPSTPPGASSLLDAPLEQRFQLLIEAVVDYAIFILSPSGYVLSWNSGAEKLKGYTRDEIVGQHFSVFYESDAVDRGWPNYELQQATTIGRFEDEGWRVRKDGTRFWANVVITAARDASNQVVGFTKVTRDMTERRRLADLEASSRRMSEFLAMLAHELRNPLAPIRNAVSIMQLEPIDSPALRNCRDIIDRQLTHMTRLVDDLLDIGRLTTGKIKLRKAPTLIAEVIARSVETVRPLIDARRHTLTVTIPDAPIHVNGDLTRLSQVVQNLLVNACRYTPSSGAIEVKVEATDQFVDTSVSDNGRGIAAAELETIFELFRQGDNGKAPDESGLGIGLTLARSLVELHGGTITAKSAGLGQGASFTFTLPVVKASREEASTEAASSEAKPLRVMVVDDNRDAADSSTDMLRLLGHDTQCVYGGHDAVRMAEIFQPEAVLLDISMPGIDGFETLRLLREVPGMRNAYVVAMTGYGAQEDTRRTHDAGFDAHLTKPAPLDALLAALENVRKKPAAGA